MKGWSPLAAFADVVVSAVVSALASASCAAYDVGQFAPVQPCRCDGTLSSNDLAVATGAGRAGAASNASVTASTGASTRATRERWRTRSLGSSDVAPAGGVPTAIGGGPPAAPSATGATGATSGVGPANTGVPSVAATSPAPTAAPTAAPTLNAPSATGVPGQYYNAMPP